MFNTYASSVKLSETPEALLHQNIKMQESKKFIEEEMFHLLNEMPVRKKARLKA
ncbi:hypothetical protein [Candidatus Berkiella aquae]|uniref:Uncharacterized protein n=1 Tax=Candidatus Berkiella aquae TaxID=295108 RepID=A0A0Q9YXZ4_9GAMM|nr:hypothetical protein [Candidatus Berkiella aquae]MCS5710449.1 hypothetical protein [Candidatus Berkiella aquae]